MWIPALIPRDDRVATSIHYKETDSHSYLNFKSSHPFKCRASIPASQFLRLRKICSEDDDFEEAATTMESFFVVRGDHVQLVHEKRRMAASTPRAQLYWLKGIQTRLGLTECQWLLPIIQEHACL